MIANIVDSFFTKISHHAMTILLSLMFTLIYDQQDKIVNKAHVEECIEILSIVWGGAGDFEKICEASSYQVGVKECEANDDQVNFAKKLKKKNDIDYAVMFIAIQFDDKFDVKINFMNRSSEEHGSNKNAIKYSKILKNLLLYIFY